MQPGAAGGDPGRPWLPGLHRCDRLRVSGAPGRDAGGAGCRWIGRSGALDRGARWRRHPGPCWLPGAAGSGLGQQPGAGQCGGAGVAGGAGSPAGVRRRWLLPGAQEPVDRPTDLRPAAGCRSGRPCCVRSGGCAKGWAGGCGAGGEGGGEGWGLRGRGPARTFRITGPRISLLRRQLKFEPKSSAS